MSCQVPVCAEVVLLQLLSMRLLSLLLLSMKPASGVGVWQQKQSFSGSRHRSDDGVQQ